MANNTPKHPLARVTEAVARRLKKRPPPTPAPSYPPDFSAEDIATLEAVAPYTMTSPERVVSLLRAVEYITRAQIPGDIVECGVWRGGSMMAVARALQRLRDTSRSLFLFDTYEGMSPPTEADRSYRGELADTLLSTQPKEGSWIWAVAQLEGVQGVMERSGYPQERVKFIKGKVEETLPQEAPERLALLRLDTDWYESTKHELEHLYPRLSPGGVLIIDDYGHWEGARRAVDEYIAQHRLPLLLQRIDYTGRIAIKPFESPQPTP
jgi:hypothetical protein